MKTTICFAAAILFLATPHVCRADTAPGFARKPSVKPTADNMYEISFEVTSPCDVTVGIVDDQKNVVKHIAYGMLGANAPAPFAKDSLSQAISWDGKDDSGKPVPQPEKLRAQVSLGLKPAFDKILNWDGLAMALSDQPIQGLVCGPDGTLYLLTAPKLGGTWLTALSREGKYLRTLLPHPANLPPEKRKAYKYAARPDGTPFPVFMSRAGAFGGSFLEKKAKLVHGQVMAFLPGEKVVCVVDQGFKKNPRHLLTFGTDGSILSETLMGTPLEQRTITKIDPPTYMAGLQDGKTLLISSMGKLSRADRTGATPSSPFGPDSIKSARGVCLDGKGNVYVADGESNEIVVLNAEGKRLRSIPAPGCDGAIAVHPTSGSLYLLSVTEGALIKLSPEGSEITRLAAPCNLKYATVPYPNVFVLDASADPPILWVANQERKSRLWRVVDKGDSFEKQNLFAQVTSPWLVTGRPLSYLALDKKRDELYVRHMKEILRFNVAAGEVETIKLQRPPAPKKKRWTSPRDIVIGPDGLLYVLTSRVPQYIWRFDRTGAHVPFPKAGDCMEVPNSMSRGFLGSRGFDVAADGDLYVEHYSRSRSIDSTDPTLFYPGDLFILVERFSPNGTMKHKELIMELPGFVGGIQVDRSNNVYLGANIRPREYLEKNKEKESKKLSHLYRADRGMLLKFPPQGGRVNFGRKAGTMGEPPEDSAMLKWVLHFHNRLRPLDSNDHLWAWEGLSPSPGGWSCCCQNARFHIDDFDRIWVPDALMQSVRVLDTAGNEILRFGDYGNPDSRGPGSPIPEPAIPLGYPTYVQAGDDVLYVNDYLNRRIVRLKIEYATEETAAVVPGN